MSGPTGPARDSSLGINKAPGISYSCREAQNADANIGRHALLRQWAAREHSPGRARLHDLGEPTRLAHPPRLP